MRLIERRLCLRDGGFGGLHLRAGKLRRGRGGANLGLAPPSPWRGWRPPPPWPYRCVRSTLARASDTECSRFKFASASISLARATMSSARAWADIGIRDTDAIVCLLAPAPRGLEIGAGDIHFHGIVPRIELHQELPGLDRRVVVHMQSLYVRRDLRRDRRQMRRHVRIVGASRSTSREPRSTRRIAMKPTNATIPMQPGRKL